MTADERIRREIAHGKKIVRDPQALWYWNTAAGKVRWERRVSLLTAHVKTGMKVLEIGCGNGFLTRKLCETGASVVGMDISSELLVIARRRVNMPHVIFIVGNAYNAPLRHNSCEAVIGSSVLHHLDINKALTEFYRILKPGGTISFTEPNMLNPQIALQKNVPFIKNAVGDSPDETAFIRWKLVEKLAEKGFKVTELRNFDFLHPLIPGGLVPLLRKVEKCAESLPVISEFSGSLYIRARKH